MISIKEIRTDLKDIRYYYEKKEFFDSMSSDDTPLKIVETAKRYMSAVQSAPPRLFEIYILLYVECLTQEAAAEKLNYTPEYISSINKELTMFLQRKV